MSKYSTSVRSSIRLYWKNDRKEHPDRRLHWRATLKRPHDQIEDPDQIEDKLHDRHPPNEKSQAKFQKTIGSKTNPATIYCRISSTDQSLDSQEFACRQFCEAQNINVAEVVHEISSARKLSNLKALNKIISSNYNSTIIVYAIDRFCRNTADAMAIIKVLDRRNINLVSVMDHINLNTASGRHAFRIRMSDAEHESDLISERVRRSLAFRKARGDHIGKPGYGYTIEVIERTGQRLKVKELQEQTVLNFIRNTCNRQVTIAAFNKELFKVLKVHNLDLVPAVFSEVIETEVIESDEIGYNNEIVSNKLPKIIITPSVIADLFYDYRILKRGKEWTEASVQYEYTKLNSINNISNIHL